MGRRGRKAAEYAKMAGDTVAREALERRWSAQMSKEWSLAKLVTATSNQGEPFHRWTHLKQGFAAQLVRQFLHQNSISQGQSAQYPLLDPFCGTGTTAIECARYGFHATGVEAVAPLAFLANTTATESFPDRPVTEDFEDWCEVANRLTEPIHRAALMLAVARQHGADGKPLKNAATLRDLLGGVVGMIQQDLRHPLPFLNQVHQGDARDLDHLKDGSVGGILTSPPYLSRHDYGRITQPLEEVYRHWYPREDQHRIGKKVDKGTDSHETGCQVAAHPRAVVKRAGDGAGGNGDETLSDAVGEICEALHTGGHARLVGVIQTYFRDMTRILQECARVLRPGKPFWCVVGGARLKGTYVPSDLILAEVAQEFGLEVQEIRVARYLIEPGRKLGTLQRVAPRESILVMRR